MQMQVPRMVHHPLLDAEGVMGKGDEKDPPLRADARTHGGEPATGKGAAADGMMDRWFQQQLRHLYNDVVNEPLPHEFLEILGKIPSRKPET
ncbi:MAG: NepR family anti-sigma factor [Dongiaceae bacterium]